MQITIKLPTGGTETFQGELLGEGSSFHRQHTHTTDYVAAGKNPANGRNNRCQACRWQEAFIYDDTTDPKNPVYVVYTRGATIIPGERVYFNLNRTDSAMAVRELLTVRKESGVFIPAPAKMALASAADLDDDLREVYDTLPAGL